MTASPPERDVYCHRDIVADAQRGDPDAFRALYDTHSPRLLGYLKTLVGEADAEDIASETWASIHTALPGYRHRRADFRTWSTAIARNHAISHLRYRGARPAIPLPPEALPHRPSATDTEHDATESIRTAGTLALLRELPRAQAAAILLCVVIGMDAVSAGRVLRKQPNAVRTAMHRGLQALRLRLPADRETSS